MNRATRFFILAAGSLAGFGCGQEVARPPDPASRIVVGTDAGPVDVLSFTEDTEGFRRIGVHAVGTDGVHAVRTLAVRIRRTADGGGGVEFTGRVEAGDALTFRMVRRVYPDDPHRTEARIESGGESLVVRAAPAGGSLRVVVVHGRPGVADRERILYLDPNSLDDPAYVAAVRRELDAFYPSGPLRDLPDRKLLEGVMASADWGAYLKTEGAGRDTRIKQVCAVASAVSLISCKAAALGFAPAWFACVPSTGVAVACLAYQLREAFAPGDESPCACSCMCNELGPPPPPPPPPPPTPPTDN